MFVIKILDPFVEKIIFTVKITLEDQSMLSALRSILSRLNGVTNVSVIKDDNPTLAAIKELNLGKGNRCKNVDELFEKLDA